MSQIDWSKAPEGAEIHLPDQAGTAECFVMFLNFEAYYSYPGMTQWVRWAGESKETLLARFRHSLKAWTGEGLPPVGTACEASSLAFPVVGGGGHRIFGGGGGGGGVGGEQFVKCTVIAHAEVNGAQVAVVNSGKQIGWTFIGKFRPIKTQEQIAAQARSKACDEMFGIMSSPPVREGNRSDMAEALYDAGYRKFEIVDE
jgi:hypothetical protein